MFPLKERKITGYKFGVPTFYSKFHLGVDYGKEGMDVFAPFDGTVVLATYGQEGGNTLWFKPDNRDVIIRFLHLSQFIVYTGKVAEGIRIAVTGNTGHSTLGHLHLDISRKKVDINNPKNFIDPEKYDWKMPMNQTRIVKSKKSSTLYFCTPIPDITWEDVQKIANVQGITVPNPIPDTDSL